MLGSAVAPANPVFPNWPLILFGSIALGLGLGVLVALITELLSRRVRGVEDLAATGVPVIAILMPANETAREPARLRLLPFQSSIASEAR
jgi:polysaccharide biosynthesis transport protein